MADTIDGVEFTILENSTTCHIHSFSEDLKGLLRKHLSVACHGKNLAQKGLAIYGYHHTLSELKNRYTDKTEEIRKGMMGELLANVLIQECFESFEIASPFFNMEEKSQRKGFDLLLIEISNNELWITEVKSGGLRANSTADSTTRTLIQDGKRDLKRRLNESEMTYWLNAINSANNAILDVSDYKDSILEILDNEATLAEADHPTSQDNNVFLISFLFHDTADLFDSRTPQDTWSSIDGAADFKKVFVFSAQKETFERIAAFLFEEELNG